MRANAPATCGAAIDVPEYASDEFVGTAEMIDEPGAYRSMRSSAVFEKPETVSLLVVEPTVTADEIHAGDETESENPLLPDAMTVAIPDAASSSTVEAIRALSHAL